MTRRTLCSFSLASSLLAQRRRVVVKRNRVVVHPGHPIARVRNRTVVVRPARRTVVIGRPLVYLPVMAFAAVTAVAVSLPARDRLVWQDTETISREEDWVDLNFGVDSRGGTIYVDIDGKAEIDFADVVFENGEVQTVDFDERTLPNGLHRVLDFPGERRVKTVRMVARAKASTSVFRLYLSR